jgi:hypothetical protein
MKMKKTILYSLLVSMIMLMNCGANKGTGFEDNFDRKVMLTNWADNLIIPAYENMVGKLVTLEASVTNFNTTPDQTTLTNLREDWFDAYIAWQYVDMYAIGKAEEITLRNYMNVFPVDVTAMEQSILAGGYDLSTINRQDEQGFPAMDYLLYGVAGSDSEIIAVYTDQVNGTKYKTYLSNVSGRMTTLVQSVLTDWNTSYRTTFINRDGSSATESVNKLVNDYLFYYEKYFRAGKVGIPAGVFSGTPLSDKVEARYSGKSKVLFEAGLNAAQDFFNGVHFNGETNGLSLDDYLNYLNELKRGEDLTQLVNDQFDLIRSTSNSLNDDFGIQISDNNVLMLELYDELQVNVINLKVDMLQALNISVDYVDADGD